MRGTIPWVIYFLLLPVLLLGQINRQQTSPYANYFGVSGDFGITTFFGDIDESAAKDMPLKNNKAWQFQVFKNFNAQFQMSGRISFGDISGHKNPGSNAILSNLYFKTQFIEYTFDASINLMSLFTETSNQRVGVYGKVGIGLVDFKTKVYSGVNDSLIGSLGYDKEATTELVIPFGLKLIYHASKSFAVSTQISASRVNTDKLDNNFGNNNSDYYHFISVGVMYKFFHDKSLIRLFGRNPFRSSSRSPGRANPSKRR